MAPNKRLVSKGVTAPLILALVLGLAPTGTGASPPPRARELSEEAAVFAGQAKGGSDPREIAVAALAGTAFYGLVAWAEKRVTFWHPSQRR